MARVPLRTVLAALAVAAAVPLVLSAAQQPAAVPAQDRAAATQQPSFRAGVDIVSLNVTVTDAGQKYVTDLNQDDFQVFEDGVKQDVTLFNRTNLPIALDIRFTLNLGVAAVSHSPPERERLNWALSSSGLTKGTEQAGLTAPMKSLLLANDAQDSTLQDPASETSTVST